MDFTFSELRHELDQRGPVAPFALAHNSKGVLVTIDPPGSIDTPAFGISLTGEIVDSSSQAIFAHMEFC